MKEKVLLLTFQLITNTDFLPGQKEPIRIKVADRLIKPDWWSWTQTNYLGNYSDTKLKLWLTFMDLLDGTDPWLRPPYYVLMPWGSWSIGEAQAKASAISFKNWLVNEQDNPYDPDLKMYVAQSLGTGL